MNYIEFENCIMRLKNATIWTEPRNRIESLLDAVKKTDTGKHYPVARDRFIKRLEEVGAIEIIKEMIGVSNAAAAKDNTEIGFVFENAQTSIFGRPLRASIHNGAGRH